MKPVKQTSFYSKEQTTKGNCFTAALASLLEVPIEHVPNFVPDAAESGEEGLWYENMARWMAERGLAFLQVDLSTHVFVSHIEHLRSVISPRGVAHSVVCIGEPSVFLHDPHPSNEFGEFHGDQRAGLIVIANMGKFLQWREATPNG